MFRFVDRPRRRRLRAVTLIEAVLYISVALALIVGGLVFFQQASMAARVQAQVRYVTAVVSEIRAISTGTTFAPYSVLDGTLIAAGAVPSDMVAATPTTVYSMAASPVATSLLKTVWDTPMLIDIADHLATSDRRFVRVTLYDIPVNACARLAVVDRGGGGIAVGTRRVSWRTPTPNNTYGPPWRPAVAVDIGAPQSDSATNPNIDPAVFEVTPTYAGAQCRAQSLDGKSVLVLNYLIDI